MSIPSPAMELQLSANTHNQICAHIPLGHGGLGCSSLALPKLDRLHNLASSSCKHITTMPKFRRNGAPLICRAGLEDVVAPATAVAYGFTLMSGGLFAYARSGSKGSLIGGLSGGLSLAIAYFLMLDPDKRDLANAIAFGSTFLFIAVFGIRFANTRKPIPSGLLLVLSIAASVVFVNAYFQARL